MWDEHEEELVAVAMREWRRDFHQHPELSNEEVRTAAVIADILRKMDIPVQTFARHHAVCGVIKGAKPGPVVALRADMDALPVTEDTGAAFRSSQLGVMHACGHDAHMAILLGCAQMLQQQRKELAGTVKLLFQPAEEASPIGGAETLIAAGLLDDVDAIFGLHVWPDLPCGQIGVKNGAMMAASDRFAITLLGNGSHAGQPHLGVDAISLAADVIQGLQQLVSRQLNPLVTATINVGQIKGGERYNVVARQAVLEGTVRTLDEATRKTIPVRMKRLLSGLTEACGADYGLDYQPGYPVLENHAAPTACLIEAAGEVIGTVNVRQDVQPVLAAEDFARYLKKVPGAFFWLGCAKAGESAYPLHNSRFMIDEAALVLGAKILCRTVENALAGALPKQETLLAGR